MSSFNTLVRNTSNTSSPNSCTQSMGDSDSSQVLAETSPASNGHSQHTLTPDLSPTEYTNSVPNGSHFYSPFQNVISSSTMLSEIPYRNLSFFISDSPDNARLPEYVKLFKEKEITDVARACDPKYDEKQFEAQGIKVHEFFFEDGGIPPKPLLTNWLSLVYECEAHNSALRSSVTTNGTGARSFSGKRSIAVHCVAGLGRAPLLVAIALIEFGMTPEDAIDYVRAKRKGCFNSKQIRFLMDTFRPRRLFTPSGSSSTRNSGQMGKAAQSSQSTNSSQESISDDSKGFFKNILRFFS